METSLTQIPGGSLYVENDSIHFKDEKNECDEKSGNSFKTPSISLCICKSQM